MAGRAELIRWRRTMRLAILDSGHSLGTKALFAFIRIASRAPVLDVVKMVA